MAPAALAPLAPTGAPADTGKGMMKSPPGFRHGPCHKPLLKRRVC